jgi:hypothetical protein
MIRRSTVLTSDGTITRCSIDDRADGSITRSTITDGRITACGFPPCFSQKVQGASLSHAMRENEPFPGQLSSRRHRDLRRAVVDVVTFVRTGPPAAIAVRVRAHQIPIENARRRGDVPTLDPEIN